MAMNARRPAQRGFTLIEIMVALALGLVLTGGAIYLFTSQSQSYRMGNAIARIQETGRIALSTLARDLRMVGYQGCMTFAAEEDAEDGDITAEDPDDRLPDDPEDIISDDPIAFDENDNALTISYLAPVSTNLAQDMTSTSDPVVLASDSGLRQGGLAMITDCATYADLFTVTQSTINSTSGEQTLQHGSTLDGKTVNGSGALSQAYDTVAPGVARVMAYPSGGGYRYTVTDTGDTNGAGDPIRALTRDGEPLLRGVESMQVRFGVWDDGSIRYIAGADLAAGQRVVAVRIGFLVHSIERVLETPDTERTYMVAGVPVAPVGESAGGLTHGTSPRLRKVFETTVLLRNRIPAVAADWRLFGE